MSTSFTIIAKAGGSDEGPANSCDAISRARKSRLADTYQLAIEVDLRLTADGGLVALHDAALARATNGHGLVRQQTLATVRALRLKGTSEHVATFPEIVEAVGDRPLVLEVHDNDRAVVAALARCIATLAASKKSQLIVASEHDQVIHCLRKHELGLRTAATAREVWRKVVLERMRLERWAPRGHLWIVPVRHRGLRVATPRFAASAKLAGDDVWVYVVQSAAELRRLAGGGVAGCFTTRPAKLAKELAASSLTPGGSAEP